MELWFELFYFNSEKKDLHDVKVMQNKFNSLLDDYLKLIENCENELRLAGLSSDKKDYYLYSIRHAVNNYLLITFTLDKHAYFKHEIDRKTIEGVRAAYFNASQEDSKFKTKSLLHACVMAITEYLYFSESRTEKSKNQSMLYKLLTNENIKKYSRKQYEKSRYHFFRKICNLSDI